MSREKIRTPRQAAQLMIDQLDRETGAALEQVLRRVSTDPAVATLHPADLDEATQAKLPALVTCGFLRVISVPAFETRVILLGTGFIPFTTNWYYFAPSEVADVYREMTR